MSAGPAANHPDKAEVPFPVLSGTLAYLINATLPHDPSRVKRNAR
jgi:hypothetical protein